MSNHFIKFDNTKTISIAVSTYSKYRMCQRKKSFGTQNKANKIAVENNMFVYECPICYGFHITKKLRSL